MPDDNASVIDGFIPPSSSPTVPKPTIGGISYPTERRKQTLGEREVSINVTLTFGNLFPPFIF
jgi:hypothetical protein